MGEDKILPMRGDIEQSEPTPKTRMKINPAPGKQGLITFSGDPDEVARDVNEFIENHDSTRSPIVNMSTAWSQLPTPGGGGIVVLSVLIMIETPKGATRVYTPQPPANGLSGA